MCHRYSLRTSRRHPASSTSSSAGSSLDRAVSAEATLELKTYRRTARLPHFAGPTGSTFEKLKQCDGKLVVFARLDRGRTWKLFQPPNEGRTCCQTLKQRVEEACVAQVQETGNHAWKTHTTAMLSFYNQWLTYHLQITFQIKSYLSFFSFFL